MEKHFPPKRSFIKSLGHERDRENKIISCSTYYDRRQKTSLYYFTFAFTYLFTLLQIVKKKKGEICAYVSVITRIKMFLHTTVL